MTLAARLLLRILPTIALAILVVGYLAYRSATAEIDHVYDAQLISDANTMWTMLSQKIQGETSNAPIVLPDLDFRMGDQLRFNDAADDAATAHMFRAWKNGRLAVTSRQAMPANISVLPAGFSTRSFEGQVWRIYALPIPDTEIVLEVAEKLTLRSDLIYEILGNIVLPLIVLLPLIGILTWMVIRNGLKQLRKLSREIRQRGTRNLSPVEVDGLPKDVAPLKYSINQLLLDLERSLSAERHFTDLAAHQLRTPQSSIKLLLQMLKSAENEKEREHLADQLLLSNERSIHVIEQILRLTRVRQQTLQVEDVVLQDMIDTIVADFGIILSARRFIVDNPGTLRSVVRTDRILLGLIITNVLDNAIKYSPDGGRLKINISDEENATWKVSISDTGPGIPVEQRESVFRPFNRLDVVVRPGTGLGLAIVADAAVRLDVRINLSTPAWGTGLQVDLFIPKDHQVRARLPSPTRSGPMP